MAEHARRVDDAPSARRRRLRTAGLAAGVLVAAQLAAVVLELGGPRTAHLLSRATLLLASLLAVVTCWHATRRAGAAAGRGWALLGATAGFWALSQAIAAVREVTGGTLAALPAPADAPSGIAVLVSVLALLAFLGGSVSSAGRMRALLDGLLIASSLLFVSWALVLEDTYREAGEGSARVLALGYPMGDVVLVALVLVIVLRAPSGARLPWALLGTGLGLFAIGHSAFAFLQLGALSPGTGPEDLSWLGGCLLVALAAAASDPQYESLSAPARAGGVVGIFVPYVPLLFAAAVAASQPRDEGVPTFLAVNGAVIVCLLLVRQVLAQLENLELTRTLERRVRERTAELRRQERHFRSLAQNASDVLTVVDAAGIIRYQSASVARVLGFQPEALVGQRVDSLFAPGEAEILRSIRSAPPPPATPPVLQGQLRRSDGSSCIAEITVANLLNDDAVRGFVLTSRDIGERRALEDRLRQQALHDPLTGLGNRLLFLDRLDHAVDRARRNPELIAVLMLDLDGFKQVNDTLGHDVGDQLLVEVARRLRDCVRQGDTVARMGGDEFAVLLERADLEGPNVVAQRIVYRLRAPVEIGGRAIVTHGSVGVALGATTSLKAEELLRNADLAMYVAKSKGKGVFEVFEPEMHAAALEHVELEADLRDALRERALTLNYQPIVELPSGRISGAEALVRWHHPVRGTISPAEFVPLAEESGLVVELGRWVLGEACRQARGFQLAYPTDPPFTIAVNVAARQLTSPWLVDEVRKALAESHLDPTTLVLEITEGALMKDASSILPTLEALRAIGVRLAIDDFGTGWSSLSRLRSFPVNKLKIDRSFIQEIVSPDDDAPIVAAIVAMAHSLHLSTVAEGVETPEQLACLHLHGCEEVQGFLLSRPLTGESLGKLLADPGGMLEPSGDSERLSASDEGLMGLVAETTLPADGITDRIGPVLSELRRVTGADVVYLTEVHWADLAQEVRAASYNDAGLHPGTRMPWIDSPCSAMLQGGSRCVADLRLQFPDHPLAADLGLASHVTVPVLTPDGRVFGTLCAAHASPGRLGESTAVLLELFARLLIEHVEAEARTAQVLSARRAG